MLSIKYFLLASILFKITLVDSNGSNDDATYNDVEEYKEQIVMIPKVHSNHIHQEELVDLKTNAIDSTKNIHEPTQTVDSNGSNDDYFNEVQENVDLYITQSAESNTISSTKETRMFIDSKTIEIVAETLSHQNSRNESRLQEIINRNRSSSLKSSILFASFFLIFSFLF